MRPMSRERKSKKTRAKAAVAITESRSRNMRAIGATDTKPELAVRRIIYSLGHRYRLHRHDLPGRPDIVFPGRMKIIFVHGCFWHCHKDPFCPFVHKPKTNKRYWTPKLQRNRSRDRANAKVLRSLGWQTLTVWECETRSAQSLERRLKSFLRR